MEQIPNGTLVEFGTRVGTIVRPEKSYGRIGYRILPIADKVVNFGTYTEFYPADLVRVAPLDWAPLLGRPDHQYRWAYEGGAWITQTRPKP